MSRYVILPLALACCASAHAGQPRDVRDGDTMEAAIAIDAPTRVRLEGQRIINVVGNIHSSSNCDGPQSGAATPQAAAQLAAPAVNARGDVILNCDLDKGEIYVRPAGTNPSKPINLFVSSPRATYTLLLRPAQMSADTLILRDRRLDASDAVAPSAKPQPATHVRALKALLVSMAGAPKAGAVEVEQVDRPVALWQESDFRLVRRHEAQALLGETYRLRNTGPSAMVLAEQEFDHDGVLAVAIEQHNLRPGEATLVHVIRGREDAR
ncbi:TraK domain-containing protein [Pseudoduganella namucuonensis]|uniref:Conjugal transfer pilus assembly protein TraK n=1 Tax=Pseudoduganella namucuonensis TaxID=1035707 RepID=A0A1I7M4D4_9BURK|nr:type-F conjugative transfer system secretin TraK [Pseudoduganella namucuonensis]SFV16737.1 conjugal transfer pilus assembly protein TraK [Pseudoduganella namucuonensis]